MLKKKHLIENENQLSKVQIQNGEFLNQKIDILKKK